MLCMQLSRDWEGRVGTPLGSLEEITGTFRWGDLSQVCYRDQTHWEGFGETNGARAITISGFPRLAERKEG